MMTTKTTTESKPLHIEPTPISPAASPTAKHGHFEGATNFHADSSLADPNPHLKAPTPTRFGVPLSPSSKHIPVPPNKDSMYFRPIIDLRDLDSDTDDEWWCPQNDLSDDESVSSSIFCDDDISMEDEEDEEMDVDTEQLFVKLCHAIATGEQVKF